MKKTFYLIYTVLFFFISCEGSNFKLDKSSDTLKSLSNQIEETFEWTDEIEKDLLSAPKINNSSNGRSKITTESLVFAKSELNIDAVYPSLSKIGLLNQSNLSEEQLNKIKNACNSFISKENIASNFDVNNLYVYKVFEYKLNKKIEEPFELKKYIIGEAFVSEDIIQIPVKYFYELTDNTQSNKKTEVSNEYNKLDTSDFHLPSFEIIIYFTNSADSIKINQIEFID